TRAAGRGGLSQRGHGAAHAAGACTLPFRAGGGRPRLAGCPCTFRPPHNEWSRSWGGRASRRRYGWEAPAAMWLALLRPNGRSARAQRSATSACPALPTAASCGAGARVRTTSPVCVPGHVRGVGLFSELAGLVWVEPCQKPFLAPVA